MGSIRTVLALIVLISHGGLGNAFIGPRTSVQIFYIISGFLISFVLTEAKTYESKKLFYTNRFLRIYPSYWIVAAFSLTIHSITSSVLGTNNIIFDALSIISDSNKIIIYIVNSIIFGMDTLMFVKVQDGHFAFMKIASYEEHKFTQSFIIQPAWSLSIELTFYLIAPFILSSKKRIITILTLSLALRVYLVAIGLGRFDPWSYRFFPTELAMFLIGSLSHQVWKRWLEERSLLSGNKPTYVFCATLAYFLLFSLIPNRSFNSWAIFLIFPACLPFLFCFQCKYRWDRSIGELSYPIYIIHMPVMYNVQSVLMYLEMKDTPLLEISITIAITIPLSYLLNKTVGRFIETLRTNVKAGKD